MGGPYQRQPIAAETVRRAHLAVCRRTGQAATDDGTHDVDQPCEAALHHAERPRRLYTRGRGAQKLHWRCRSGSGSAVALRKRLKQAAQKLRRLLVLCGGLRVLVGMEILLYAWPAWE